MNKSQLLTTALGFAIGVAVTLAVNEFRTSNVISDSDEGTAALGKGDKQGDSRIVSRDGDLEEVLKDAGFHSAYAFRFSGGLLGASLYPKDAESEIVQHPSKNVVKTVIGNGEAGSSKIGGHLLVLIDRDGTAQICSRIQMGEDQRFGKSLVPKSPKVGTALIWNESSDGKGGGGFATSVTREGPISPEEFERDQLPGVSILDGKPVFTLKWLE